MYQPAMFSEDRHEIIVEMVRSVGFGHLTYVGAAGLASTPIPFVVDDDLSTVRFHVARPNPIVTEAPGNGLLIVPVADAYISPSWYPSKQVDHQVVPTWNYEVVHLHGRITIRDDADWTGAQVSELTDVHEAQMHAPWVVTDAPSDYIHKRLRAIVGVELNVERIDAKRKLSQNQPEDNQHGVVAGLAHPGAVANTPPTIAEAMAQLLDLDS